MEDDDDQLDEMDDELEDEDNDDEMDEDEESEGEGNHRGDVQHGRAAAQLLVDDDEDDEEESSEEEEVVENQVEENEDNYNTSRLERFFDEECKTIAANREACQETKSTFRLNDATALQLGKALIGNTHLQLLTLWLGRNLTMKGVRALLSGIQGSSIETLSLAKSNPHLPLPLELSPLYVQAMRMVKNLHWALPLNGETASVLASAFMSKSTLSMMPLEHFILPLACIKSLDAAHQLAQGLHHSPFIQHLTLIGTKALEDDDDALLTPPNTLKILKVIFKQGIQGSRSIQHVSLKQLAVDVNILMNILPRLRQLEIHKVALTVEQVQALQDYFFTASSSSSPLPLQGLVLSKCMLGDEHLRILAPSLVGGTVLPSLRHVSLQENQIGDEGIASFLEHWTDESFLDSLNFSKNQLSHVSVLRLIQTVPPSSLSSHHNSTVATPRVMEELNLGFNRATIGYDELQHIGEALPGKKLIKLKLARTFTTVPTFADDDTSQEAVDLRVTCNQAGKALLHGVQNNVYLKTLITTGMMALPAQYVIKELAFYLLANCSGRALLLEQNRLPFGVWSIFLARQRMNASLLFVFLRELPILFVPTMTTATSAGGRHGGNNNRGVKRQCDMQL